MSGDSVSTGMARRLTGGFPASGNEPSATVLSDKGEVNRWSEGEQGVSTRG